LVSDDTAGSTEMEEVGVDEVEGIIRNDGEDEGDDNGSSDDVIHIDDTSSEASSMLNDPSIQPFVPVVSSSDENESEAGRYWTLPSTSRDDFEDMEILYLVKWRNMREAKLIESSVMYTYRPQMVMDYWESLVKGR